MEKPTTVSRVSNPTITTIEKQLDSLAQTANKIGMFTKEQQVALLNQIQQKKRVASEGQLEQKNNAVPELPDIGASSDLAPLDQSIEGLIKKLDKLAETVDRNNGAPGAGGGGGLLGGAAMGLGGAALLAGLRGRGAGLGKLLGKPRPQGPPVSNIAANDNIRVARQPGALTRAGAYARGLTSARPTRSGSASNMVGSSKVASTMAAGLSNAGRAGRRAGVGAAVRRVAGPIIAKALGSTVLKSIPLLGIGVGAAFAIGRLLKGDVIGAGVDLASGTGGALTAVPALGATVARDTYAEVYGVQPEQDPQFNQRFPELKSEIEKMIKEELSRSVTTKTLPTRTDIETQDTPSNPPQAAPVSQPPPVPPPHTPAGASGSSPSGAPAADSVSSPAAATAPVTPSSGDMSGAAISPPPSMMPSASATGEAITSYQMPVSADWQQYGFTPSQGTFTPQTSSESRAGRQGIGQIPSPMYDSPHIEALKKSLFFGY
jgi:hypothetical protein